MAKDILEFEDGLEALRLLRQLRVKVMESGGSWFGVWRILFHASLHVLDSEYGEFKRQCPYTELRAQGFMESAVPDGVQATDTADMVAGQP